MDTSKIEIFTYKTTDELVKALEHIPVSQSRLKTPVAITQGFSPETGFYIDIYQPYPDA